MPGSTYPVGHKGWMELISMDNCFFDFNPLLFDWPLLALCLCKFVLGALFIDDHQITAILVLSD